MFEAKRASANSIINRVLSNASKGLGVSKIKARNESGIRGENGHKVSDKSHSVKDLQQLRSITKQYINFVKENYNGKVANNINSDSAKAFLAHKAKEVKGSTLNTYISEFRKMVDNLNKDKIGNLNREDIQNIKNELKKEYNLSKEHKDRAYSDVGTIKQSMQNTTMSLSVELQAFTGIRADDALNSHKWQINQDNTLTIHGSKGGITYTTVPLNQELIQKIKEAKEIGYKVNYSEYRTAFKEMVQHLGQNYTGTHGLRYSFAQNRYEELKLKGFTELEAKGQISLEMGHSRIEITEHYLK